MINFVILLGDGKLQHTEAEEPVSVNSPAGDSSPLAVPQPPDLVPTAPSAHTQAVAEEPVMYTIDVAKCHVVHAEVCANLSLHC